MKAEILSLADKYLGECVALRHDLHRIPEIAGKEFKTAALLRERMTMLPLTFRAPFLGTDTVALLNEESGGRNITLRADIDALPIAEETGVSYASTHPGMSHACGHDGHMAMLYGAMRILCDLKDRLPSGSVRFVFQPGEESCAMARDLVAAGVLERPKADLCAALHGWPNTRYGAIATRAGAIMAAAVHWRLVITGRGGHGSMPDKAISPFHSIARITERLRNECPPVCSVCHIDGGFNQNIIPDTAMMEGTCRSLSDETGDEIEKVFKTVVDEVCREESTTYELDYDKRYPVTLNAPDAAELARAVTEKYLGKETFEPMPHSAMSSEDFSYFLRKCPGVYCHLGLGDHAALHKSKFDFDDSVIRTGMVYFAGLAVEFLSR